MELWEAVQVGACGFVLGFIASIATFERITKHGDS